jgi:predicted PurR-regulated permease PerM
VALFVTALIIWFVIRVVNVLLLAFVAALLAVYLSAVTDQLERRLRLARGLGLAVAVIVTLALVVGIWILFVPPVVAQTTALIAGLPQTLSAIQTVLARMASDNPIFSNTGFADPESGLVPSVIADATEWLRGALFPYLRAGGKLLIDAVAAVTIALYFAQRPTAYRDGILALISPRHREVAATIFQDLGATLRAWVIGQLLAMVILAALTAVGLLALGVPYWLAFGIFTGLVALVPFFGTLVSTILPALFVVGTGNWLQVAAVLVLGTAVHIIGMNVIIPLIMQRTVAIPPALTIVGILIMGTLLGAVGLVVAVPIIAITIVIVRHVLQEGIYGEGATPQPAVLRPSRGRPATTLAAPP